MRIYSLVFVGCVRYNAHVWGDYPDGASKPLNRKNSPHWLEGREYPINDAITVNSFEPPTALNHGGVFINNKNNGVKNNDYD